MHQAVLAIHTFGNNHNMYTYITVTKHMSRRSSKNNVPNQHLQYLSTKTQTRFNFHKESSHRKLAKQLIDLYAKSNLNGHSL